MDPKFRVELLSQTPNPQQVVYAAMRQDYSEKFIFDTLDSLPDDQKSGELIVKHLLQGNRGHYGCYSSDTEVLTDSGWKLWPEISNQDKLLAVDINSNTAKFEVPSQLQAFDFDENDKMYSVESAFLNIKVTGDHRMVVSSRTHDGTFSKFYFKTADEIERKPVRYLLNTCLDASERKIPSVMPLGIDPLTAFKVAGFFFGDGLRSNNISPVCIRFRLRRPRKIAYLLSLGLPTSEMKGDRYVIRHESLASWIHKFFSSPTGKIVPNWLIHLPQDMVASFWDGLKNSDGTRIKEKAWAYDSCEKQALGIIQATAHINGFSANLLLNHKNSGDNHLNHRECWRLAISEKSTYRVECSQKGRSPGITESRVDYSGKVYCATVSTGALMVRRNGKPVILGNCLEHPQLVLNFGYFPHSVMQQVRTHRNVSFDVQCLAGDTAVSIYSPATGLDTTWTMEKLYLMWLFGDLSDQNMVRRMNVKCLDEETGRFTVNHIKEVIRTGINPIYRLRLADGKQIDCTENHRLLTDKGWLTLADIEVGSSLMVAERSRTYASATPRRPHHGIGDRAQSAQVVSIDFLGVEPTYDLEMEDPHHNFVANDIVVHNSFRYTGDRIVQVAQGKADIEDVFYLRPVGAYNNRQGKKYEYTAEQRQQDLEWCLKAASLYSERVEQGLAEEHARGLIPFDVRQHWVMSGNARAIMHLLDIRGKFDVQPETRVMTEMMFEKFKLWMPEVAAWYEKNRWRKGTLAP